MSIIMHNKNNSKALLNEFLMTITTTEKNIFRLTIWVTFMRDLKEKFVFIPNNKQNL